MTPKEIIMLFVDCAMELSEKGLNPHLYYQDNVSLMKIYTIRGGQVYEYAIYLDREKPYTKEEVAIGLNQFKSVIL